jgi:hypothetical protein
VQRCGAEGTLIANWSGSYPLGVGDRPELVVVPRYPIEDLRARPGSESRRSGLAWSQTEADGEVMETNMADTERPRPRQKCIHGEMGRGDLEGDAVLVGDVLGVDALDEELCAVPWREVRPEVPTARPRARCWPHRRRASSQRGPRLA